MIDDRIFVLLHLPQVEIVEFDFLGNEKNRFRSPEVTNVLDYFGLGIQNERGVRKFYVGGSGVAREEDSSFLAQFAVATSRLTSTFMEDKNEKDNFFDAGAVVFGGDAIG